MAVKSQNLVPYFVPYFRSLTSPPTGSVNARKQFHHLGTKYSDTSSLRRHFAVLIEPGCFNQKNFQPVRVSGLQESAMISLVLVSEIKERNASAFEQPCPSMKMMKMPHTGMLLLSGTSISAQEFICTVTFMFQGTGMVRPVVTQSLRLRDITICIVFTNHNCVIWGTAQCGEFVPIYQGLVQADRE